MKKKPPEEAEGKLRNCPNRGVPYLIGDNSKHGKRIITKARCKQWDCEYCKHVNKSEHVNRIAKGVVRFEYERLELTFVTITCHEKWRGHENSIRNWRKSKDKLLARYRRKVKKEGYSRGDYVYIPELHKDGTLHIHGLFTGGITTRWWKDNARECGLGYMAESTIVKNSLQAVNYCTKYIIKEMGKSSISKGFRRINYSRGFPTLKKNESDYDWRILESTESIKDAIFEGFKKSLSVNFDKKDWSIDDFLG